jgi:hypothetical protein
MVNRTERRHSPLYKIPSLLGLTINISKRASPKAKVLWVDSASGVVNATGSPLPAFDSQSRHPTNADSSGCSD